MVTTASASENFPTSNRLSRTVTGDASCTEIASEISSWSIRTARSPIAICSAATAITRWETCSTTTSPLSGPVPNSEVCAISIKSDLAAMAACPDFEVCRGWCPHERYLSSRHDPSFSEGCCGLRPLIDHIRSRQAGAPTTSRETREHAQRPTALTTAVPLPMPKRGPSADVPNRRADRLRRAGRDTRNQ